MFFLFLQMYEGQQRFVNGSGGGNVPMMHMGGAQQPPIYPFGMEHLEPPHVPKVDQHTSWDANPNHLMDDKHMVCLM